ncbi:hypothetical protein NDA10_001439 [Ustilago hordei]|nr:hypothetical protein NDA10_001439 [Ustilago hordei]KAJ1574180.1 hypothetical protein NDA12_006526 [Ustilago hordei]KAJ1574350.1 hypothetical protein NDA15_000037 [Ustilago hordei]UTT90799.1 hypothetical protein NDA17_005528 [Ustilago hordei]
MTRASTSAANFGLLLVALVLMLHSVVGEPTSRHVPHHLSPRGDDRYKYCLPKFTPNYADYKARCEAGSDLKHTCFIQWAGDLKNAEVCPYVVPLHPMSKLMIKDDTMKDFAMENPTDSFKITYPHFGGVSFLFENFDNKTGCKDITLRGGKNISWRLWVSDDDGNGKDIDTLNYKWTIKTLCSKWIHIHVKQDGWPFTT